MSTALETPVLDRSGIRNVNFFNGRLLTASDLTRLQAAVDTSDRRLGRGTGDGIVCGLEVDAPDPQAAAPSVRVQNGLAFNRAGETLCLDTVTSVALMASPDPTVTANAGFAPCAPLAGGTYIAGAGIYLLTICSARATEGRAMTSSLNDTAGKCNIDAIVRTVQFRLIQLDAYLSQDDYFDANKQRHSDHALRSRVSAECFGLAALAKFDSAPLSVDAGNYGLMDALRKTGTLSDCDVPLAILYWTLTGGIRFVDPWAVRRRTARPNPAGPRTPILADRRIAETEALILQFETQAEKLRLESGAAAASLHVEDQFAYLPPAAYIRVGSKAYDAVAFLGAHAPPGKSPTPLAGGLARAVILHACEQSAVPVIARDAANAGQAIAYRIYQVDGAQDYVLIARSSLGEVVARDVFFDNTVCCFDGAVNVQDALDALCRQTKSCCTVVVGPTTGWAKQLATLPAGSDAEICFQSGTFTTETPVEIAGLRHVKVTGAGFGSRIVAASEAGLVFRNCASVTLRDLHAETRTAGSGTDATRNLGGALSFLDCGSVRVDNVSAKCASGPVRAAACIVVRNTRPAEGAASTSVSIQRARCAVGHAQTGILVVNAAHVAIDGNEVALAEGAGFGGFASDRRHLRRLRRNLLSIYLIDGNHGKAPPVLDREHAAAPSYKVQIGDVSVAVRTLQDFVENKDLGNVWTRIVTALKREFATPLQLAQYLKELATEVVLTGRIAALKDERFTPVLLKARKALLSRAAPAAGQGIVVAGAIADEVRIRDNIVSGVEQGVHVGLSFGPRRTKANWLSVGHAQISGNRIDLSVSSLSSGERHAIFVGNCNSLVIRDNAGTLANKAFANVRAATEILSVEPIRLWGLFGPRLIVTANHFQGYKQGIYLRPLGSFAGVRINMALVGNASIPTYPWVIQHNSVVGATSALEHASNFQLQVETPNFT